MSLAPEGTILLLFSSFSKKNIIDEIINKNLLEATQIDQQHISFETLYVYAIKKSPLLQDLEKPKITEQKGSAFLKEFKQKKRSVGYSIDEKDKEILLSLGLDGRIPLMHLAKKIRLTPISVKKRLQRLIEEGYIKNFIPFYFSQKFFHIINSFLA